MNFDRWIERIYSERDIGRGIATAFAGAAGLPTYLYWDDWVIAAFAAIIAFPIGRIGASAVHSVIAQSRERKHDIERLRETLKNLGTEEKSVVQGFVWHGGSVMTWREFNKLPYMSAAGIESLLNRDLASMSVTADGMTETFLLDTQLFDYAQTVLPKEPF